jgi:hypothetical protein
MQMLRLFLFVCLAAHAAAFVSHRTKGSTPTSRCRSSNSLVVTDLLDDAVSKLSDVEKYNTVLQGMLSRAETSGIRKRDDARAALDEVWALLDEMAQRRLKCNDATLKRLIDTAAAAEDVSVMSRALRQARASGVAVRFSSDQARLTLLPTDARKRERAVADAPALPLDDREAEVTAGLAFLATAGSAALLEVLGEPLFGAQNSYGPTAVLVLLAAAAFGASGHFLRKARAMHHDKAP